MSDRAVNLLKAPAGPTATVTISVDHTFSVPGDHRRLGVILSEVGFGPGK